ncbi:MAG: DNA mismatch repair endonuclease MutL [Caldilineaceae bacterium]
MPIQLLAPDVAAKIAAGEVVERPANVVKELLENSLDAGATEVRVEIREGGQRLLRVIDNGAGIPAAEAPLAFERHATSKLATADDLTHIGTFGFRGEALYSIAAVSHVTLTTRHRDEEFGTQLRLEGGVLQGQSRAGAAVGTVVTVEHLFFNVPARRKFLRKAATEAGRISNVVQFFALAYPACRFSFVNENRLVFQSTGSGDLFDVLVKIYGLEHARQMVPVGDTALEATLEATTGVDDLLAGSMDDEIDFGAADAGAQATDSRRSSAVTVTGYVSLPTLSRANRSDINLFVNRRYIEDRNLTYAVTQAYHTLLPGGRFPIAAVFVHMPTDEIDVNVHPQKTQVRFIHDRKIFSAVQKAVRRAVMGNAPVPDMALDAPDQSPHAPDADTGAEPRPGWSARRESILDAGRPQPEFDLYTPPPAQPPRLSGHTLPADAASAPPPATTSAPAADAGSDAHAPSPSTAPQAPLQETKRKLPPLRVVGQVGTMYIVAEGPEGVYLIDQHAAHERILYEKFMAQRYGLDGAEVPRQHLLEPLTLHTGSELAGQVAQHLDVLNRIGFEVEPFGGDTFIVRAVPAVLSGDDPRRGLDEIVQTLGDRRNMVGEELEARLVKMVCKRAAIKAGQQLSVIEMRELVRQLEECQAPRTCPHGRPTMIQLSAGELEKAFGRI